MTAPRDLSVLVVFYEVFQRVYVPNIMRDLHPISPAHTKNINKDYNRKSLSYNFKVLKA